MNKVRIFFPLMMVILAVLACGSFEVQESTGSDIDFDDTYETTRTESIGIGESGTAQLDDVFDAHNWVFQGTSGQQVTIQVNGIGDTDPRFNLYGPNGDVIADADDTNGLDAQAQVTLPADGEYIIRVDVFTTGQYEVILTSP